MHAIECRRASGHSHPKKLALVIACQAPSSLSTIRPLMAGGRRLQAMLWLSLGHWLLGAVGSVAIVGCHRLLIAPKLLQVERREDSEAQLHVQRGDADSASVQPRQQLHAAGGDLHTRNETLNTELASERQTNTKLRRRIATLEARLGNYR